MSWLDSLPISEQTLTWLVGLSVVSFIASLILIPWLITRLPEDYFVDRKRHPAKLRQLHPGIYILIRVIKNLLGLLLIVAGIIMLVLPGQGILAIFVGIGLTDFPGKFRLERWMAKKPALLRAMNWIRRQRNIQPLLEP